MERVKGYTPASFDTDECRAQCCCAARTGIESGLLCANNSCFADDIFDKPNQQSGCRNSLQSTAKRLVGELAAPREDGERSNPIILANGLYRCSLFSQRVI